MCRALCLVLGLKVTKTGKKVSALLELTVPRDESWREILTNLERCINKIITNVVSDGWIKTRCDTEIIG